MAFERVVELARSERADVLLLAGDLFESETVRKPTVERARDLLASLGEMQVFIAPGNHDPFTRTSYYATLSWPPNVTVFGPEWRAVGVRGRKAFVHGWGFPNPHVSERVLERLRVAHPDAINIALVHGSDDEFPSAEERYLPLSRDDCLACGADYVALGHFHVHRVVAERAGILAAYPGAPESLDFGQSGRHGVLVGKISKEGNALRLVEIGAREHISLELDVTGAKAPEEVRDRVLAAASMEDRRRHFYRVTLSGEVEPALELDTEGLARELAGGDGFHYVELADRTRPEYDLQALAGEDTLRGRFVSRLLQELHSAANDEERREIELALRFGLRALEEAR